jgi:hypothetical protein
MDVLATRPIVVADRAAVLLVSGGITIKLVRQP